jgi:hypothetical protein
MMDMSTSTLWTLYESTESPEAKAHIKRALEHLFWALYGELSK